MVTFPRDNRFPEPGVDARFSTPGVDWRFKDAPADNRFPSPGNDRRWMGDRWDYTSPDATTAPTLTPATGEVGTGFTFTLGAASGNPTPTSSVDATLNGGPISAAGGVYTPDTAGTLTVVVTWSNGVAPNAVRTLTATVTAPPDPDPPDPVDPGTPVDPGNP